MSNDVEKVSDALSVRREVHLIEKYGMRLEVAQRHEQRTTWEQRFELETGEKLTLQQVEALKESGKIGPGAQARVVWDAAEPAWVGAETVYSKLYDNEAFITGADVWFYGTSDGPIIATVPPEKVEGSSWVTFYDPAHVKYSNNGNIELLPIFGVARTMSIHVSALKQRVALSKVMAEVYLQFVMQNRQYKYELRPVRPMASSLPLENDEVAPSVEVATA